MGKSEWEVVPFLEPFIGPPKPESCTKGWQSHTWDLELIEGSMGLSTRECRLCNDGVQDVLYPENLNGEFPVRLSLHHEVVGHYSPEHEVWWVVAPAADDEVKRLQAVVDADENARLTADIERLRAAGDALAERLHWWTDDTDEAYPDHQALQTWNEIRRD
jgi:hypothetical protein